MMDDPFEKLRKLAGSHRKTRAEFWAEIRALRAAGYSYRAIAEVAGMSHNTVYRHFT